MTFIEQISIPIFVLWIIGLVLVAFRKDLDYLYKSIFLLVFAFYVIVFFPDLARSYYRIKENYPIEIRNWIYGLGKLYFYFLLVLWPVTLIRVFYSASGYLSHVAIKTLIGFTVFYWILFGFWLLWQQPIDNFLNNQFLQIIKF